MGKKCSYELFLLYRERNRRKGAKKERKVSGMSDTELEARIKKLEEDKNG